MFLNIAYITKVNVASLNGGEGTGGNVTVMKKITNYKGDEFAYVSGQALRRYMKETLLQLGNKITEVDEKGQPTFRDEKGKTIDLDKKLKEHKEVAQKSVAPIKVAQEKEADVIVKKEEAEKVSYIPPKKVIKPKKKGHSCR